MALHAKAWTPMVLAGSLPTAQDMATVKQDSAIVTRGIGA